MSRRHRWGITSLVVIATLCAACGSSTKKASTPAGGGRTAQPSTALGQGVTDKTVKLGVALVDFNFIKPFVDGVRIQQKETYQLYIDNINAHGGLAGKQIQPVYETYNPIGNAGALALCTKFSEDEKVFAVVGTFVDFSGDAQTC
ncbi:MAG TPA: hypothetical protein VLL25_09700, partial [Acidimicrobiales bacterium]|nr:hypothetical protein [Acidimicrobiales bacterium]